MRSWYVWHVALNSGRTSTWTTGLGVARMVAAIAYGRGGLLTALKEYVERMKEGQDEIYYLTGESRGVVENSPRPEAFKEKGYEALYLIEPVDELLTQSLWDYRERSSSC